MLDGLKEQTDSRESEGRTVILNKKEYMPQRWSLVREANTYDEGCVEQLRTYVRLARLQSALAFNASYESVKQKILALSDLFQQEMILYQGAKAEKNRAKLARESMIVR